MKIGILEPDGFSKQAINDLKKIGSVELYTGKNFVKFLNNKNILFIRLKYHINDAFLKTAKIFKYYALLQQAILI